MLLLYGKSSHHHTELEHNNATATGLTHASTPSNTSRWCCSEKSSFKIFAVGTPSTCIGLATQPRLPANRAKLVPALPAGSDAPAHRQQHETRPAQAKYLYVRGEKPAPRLAPPPPEEPRGKKENKAGSL